MCPLKSYSLWSEGKHAGGHSVTPKWVLSVDFFIHSSSVSCKLLVPQKPTRSSPGAPEIQTMVCGVVSRHSLNSQENSVLKRDNVSPLTQAVSQKLHLADTVGYSQLLADTTFCLESILFSAVYRQGAQRWPPWRPQHELWLQKTHSQLGGRRLHPRVAPTITHSRNQPSISARAPVCAAGSLWASPPPTC